MKELKRLAEEWQKEGDFINNPHDDPCDRAGGRVYQKCSKQLLEALSSLHTFNPEKEAPLPKELIGFLLGECEYQGYDFGDRPPLVNNRPIRFWWRNLIRQAVKAQEKQE